MSKPNPLIFLGFVPFSVELSENSIIGDYIIPKDHPLKEKLYELIKIIEGELERRSSAKR